MQNQLIAIDNITLRQDSEGRYCLNDLHKAAGGEPKHKPGNWARRVETAELVNEI